MGTKGPWVTESDHESLYLLRQHYTDHKEDRITSVQEILDEIEREQLDLGRRIAVYLRGYRP